MGRFLPNLPYLTFFMSVPAWVVTNTQVHRQEIESIRYIEKSEFFCVFPLPFPSYYFLVNKNSIFFLKLSPRILPLSNLQIICMHLCLISISQYNICFNTTGLSGFDLTASLPTSQNCNTNYCLLFNSKYLKQ